VAGCLDVIESHASVREYTGEPVEESHLNAIIEAARRAPTAWNLQPITVIAVTERGLLERLARDVGGQEHVARASVFLVFALDARKVWLAARSSGVEPARPGLGHLATWMLDAGIAAGWAALAAEELGYGVAFIAVYGNPCSVAETLHLPQGVLPVVGLAIGRPAERPGPRPRQPPEAFWGRNRYPNLPPRAMAEAVAGVYGGRAARLYRHVLAAGGYYERVSSVLERCLQRLDPGGDAGP